MFLSQPLICVHSAPRKKEMNIVCFPPKCTFRLYLNVLDGEPVGSFHSEYRPLSRFPIAYEESRFKSQSSPRRHYLFLVAFAFPS